MKTHFKTLFTGALLSVLLLNFNAKAQIWTVPANTSTWTSSDFYGTGTGAGAGDLVFKTQGVENMRISGNGNVGIGINAPAPATNFVVYGASDPSMNVTSGSASVLQFGINTIGGSYCKAATPGDASIVNRSTGTGDLIFVNSLSTGSTGHGAIRFVTSSSGYAGETERMTILNSGQVMIGTPCTTLPTGGLLGVNGTIYTKGVRVELPNASNCFPDYVFGKDYKLLSLEEVEKYVRANKHLPEVPSANEVEKNGIDAAEMDAVLLKKIEELTLYLIEMKKKNKGLKKEIEAIKNK
jgi:hypothetical protein